MIPGEHDKSLFNRMVGTPWSPLLGVVGRPRKVTSTPLVIVPATPSATPVAPTTAKEESDWTRAARAVQETRDVQRAEKRVSRSELRGEMSKKSQQAPRAATTAEQREVER